ncbi:MAG: exodeoxyribonuclease VII small subunit [Ignavibacteriales bacterium]|nr:exodeoxyribonuclease VII small subunit [Ignavibacteriales bacterium]
MAAAKKEQKRSFETLMERLEEIVELLEQGELPLDKAISLYEEGAKISAECNDFLAATELKIKKLTKDVRGSVVIEDFEEREENA